MASDARGASIGEPVTRLARGALGGKAGETVQSRAGSAVVLDGAPRFGPANLTAINDVDEPVGIRDGLAAHDRHHFRAARTTDDSDQGRSGDLVWNAGHKYLRNPSRI